MQPTPTDFFLDKLIAHYQAQPPTARATINTVMQVLLVILLIGFCYGAGEVIGEYYGHLSK